MELQAAGRMDEVGCRAPGIAQSSFPARLMRQGVKKHHGRDLLSSPPSRRYGQVGQAMVKASLPQQFVPVVLGERYLPVSGADVWPQGHGGQSSTVLRRAAAWALTAVRKVQVSKSGTLQMQSEFWSLCL